MGRRHLRLGALLAAIVIGVGAAACGSEDESQAGADGGDGEKGTIIINQYSKELALFTDRADGAAARAEELGYDVEVEYGDSTPETQINQIDNAITQQPAGIVISPVNADALVAPLRRAQEAGIPVVTVGNTVSDDSVILAFVGYDSVEVGRLKAEYLVEQLDGEGRVGYIHGIRGSTFSEDQRKGADEVFSEHPGIEIVDGGYSGAYTSDVGLDKTQNLLTRDPNLDAIFFTNDDLAIGGIQALKERGMLKDIITVGADGAPPGLDAVRAGELDFTVSSCGYVLGETAVDVLDAYIQEGEEPEKWVKSKLMTFTPDDIEQKTEELDREDCGSGL